MYCKNCGKSVPELVEICPDCVAKAEDDRKRQLAHDQWRAQMAQKLNQQYADSKSRSTSSSPNMSRFCTNCGTKIDSKMMFCPSCGAKTGEDIKMVDAKPIAAPADFPTAKASAHGKQSDKICPRCGSRDIDVQVHQEVQGSKTVTRTKSKYRQKRHGLFWWLFIGWWWIFIDLLLWIYIFPIRFLIQLFKKKDYNGTSKSIENTKSKIAYRTVYLCKTCGYHWQK